jgi:hypothetical protein
VDEILENMAMSDPTIDAARAVATNDLRFVAISHTYAPAIPGITDYDDAVYTNGVRWVGSEGQGFTSRTLRKAIEYATTYNKIVLSHLEQN